MHELSESNHASSSRNPVPQVPGDMMPACRIIFVNKRRIKQCLPHTTIGLHERQRKKRVFRWVEKEALKLNQEVLHEHRYYRHVHTMATSVFFAVDFHY
jgi:hypothetical protein